jgi:anti-sigma factor ChrR (cupin superfamily)
VTSDPATDHLSPETVAAFLDGRLGDGNRATAEAHLSVCTDCRREIVELRALLARSPATRAPRRILVPLAAAAALALAIGIPATRSGWTGNQPQAVDRTRPGPSARLTVLGPAPDAVLDGQPTFAWHAADAGSRFKLTLVDEQGATLWSVDTGDTVVTPPHDVVLAPGRTYFWYVDALGADGRSMTSGAQRFTVR